jgi:hypothetical protein
MRKVRLPTPIFELIAKTVLAERLAIGGHQEGKVLRRRRRNYRGKIGMYGDIHIHRTTVFVLRLPIQESAILNVLLTEPNRVFATPGRI